MVVVICKFLIQFITNNTNTNYINIIVITSTTTKKIQIQPKKPTTTKKTQFLQIANEKTQKTQCFYQLPTHTCNKLHHFNDNY